MTAGPRSPLEGIARLVVDGTNLLHQLARGRAAPPAALVGRLRAAIPAPVFVDLVFDGVDAGPKGRVATGMHVRFAGRRPADDVIAEIVAAETRGGADVATATAILVVTDDRELRLRLQAAGVRTARTHWLLARLDLPVLAAPAPGNRRPAAGGAGSIRAGTGAGPGAGPGAARDPEDERRPWSPGRGATAKRGPARKVARHRRHPRMPGS
jgi:rRNA-processing protein FCF1